MVQRIPNHIQSPTTLREVSRRETTHKNISPLQGCFPQTRASHHHLSIMLLVKNRDPYNIYIWFIKNKSPYNQVGFHHVIPFFFWCPKDSQVPGAFFSLLRCVLDDLNNAPGEALSSLLGALTRQEREFEVWEWWWPKKSVEGLAN